MGPPCHSARQAAIQEELAKKRQKKGSKNAPASAAKADPKTKGLTLTEMEEQEGGPVKESLVGMAQVRRAQTRKATDKEVARAAELGGTEVPEDVEAFEEEAEERAEEEAEEPMEPFNLKEEREQGHFDEAGNYVINKDEANDAWLDTDGGKLVSEAVRKRIKEQQEAEAVARRAAPMTDRQIARLKMEAAQLMQPGETLTRALKRLGGDTSTQHRAMGKRERAKLLAQAAAAAGGGGGAGGAGGDKDGFLRITEIANTLLEEGEMDVYEASCEELQRSAAMWLTEEDAAPAQKKQATGVAAATAGVGAAAAAAAAGDDDMFAEEDTEMTEGQAGTRPAATAVPSRGGQAGSSSPSAAGSLPHVDSAGGSGSVAGPPPPPPAPLPPKPSSAAADDGAVDYASWPTRELKRFLEECGVDCCSVVEKGELVSRVRELADAGPEADAFSAPTGYAFDPAAGGLARSGGAAAGLQCVCRAWV